MVDCLLGLRIVALFFLPPIYVEHHHRLTSQFPKRSQCKHQPKTDLERHVVVHRALQINALHVPLQPVYGDEVVSFPRRVLFFT
jgi:hypothetical protein